MTILSTFVRSFSMVKGTGEAHKQLRPGASVASALARVGACEQAVLTKKFPECAAVLLRGGGSASNISIVRPQHGKEKIMLKATNGVGFEHLKRLFFRVQTLVGKIEISDLDRLLIGEQDGAGEHVLQLAHVAWPGMN